MLAVGIDHREGHLVVVIAAVDWIAAQVAQRVVHPAHVPFEPEAEPAKVHGPGNAWPGRGLLGDHRDAGHAPVAGGVYLTQERHRVEVLAAAERIRRPLAGLA